MEDSKEDEAHVWFPPYWAKSPVWDGTIRIMREVYINGVRHEPGVYQASFSRVKTKPDEPLF